MGRSLVGALPYASSPSNLLLDPHDLVLSPTSQPHRGLSSSLTQALLLGYGINGRARASVRACQKDLSLLTMPAPHVDPRDLEQSTSHLWPWIRAHLGQACNGWKQPAVFSPALTLAVPPVLALPNVVCPSPCTGLRSPRLSQPGPYYSLCPCTQPLTDRLSRSRRSVLPRLLKNQAGASSSWVRAVCWPQHAATPSPRVCPHSSIATSRQPPSWAGVSRLLSSALRPAAEISEQEGKREKPPG